MVRRSTFGVPSKRPSVGACVGAPDGGFYLYPSFEAVLRPGEGSGELASALLDEQRVATVPGLAFWHDAHLRFSHATPDAVVDEASVGSSGSSRRVRPSGRLATAGAATCPGSSGRPASGS